MQQKFFKEIREYINLENTLDYNHVKLDPVQLQFKNLKQRL